MPMLISEEQSDVRNRPLSDGDQAEKDWDISPSSTKVGVLLYLVIDPSPSDRTVRIGSWVDG